ncbi:MAG: discoidin domain-containing protein [Thermoanaerobaculia bacterium]
MKRRALLALLLAVSCSRPAPKQVAATKPLLGKGPTDTVNEQTNLIDITRGATIVSRTGESVLITSALATIDGDINSFWTPPPHDYPQSIVVALGAPSRVDRVGFRSITFDGYEANHVTFERSLDGVAWQPLATMTSRHVSDAQWLGVTPSDTAYLRITIPDSKNPGLDVRLQSLFAHGTESAPRHDPSLDGCWTINGVAAAFVQRGSRATGIVTQGKTPFSLAGGTNGRMWRFNWIRGNDYGYTALTISPDGKHLSALNWHEEAIPLFAANAWFGERTACIESGAAEDVPMAVLRRAGHVSMFALQFDPAGELLVDASRDELQSLVRIIHDAPVDLRIVAHELHQPDAAGNKAITEHEIASLRTALANMHVDLTRVDFLAAGSDATRQTPSSEAARAIYSSVEVEVRR